MIDGKRCTIPWYVDANKLSHVDPKVVDSVLDIIGKVFGKVIVIRGKVFIFLGMKINITKDKTIEISSKNQIEEAFELFGKKLENYVTSPATKRLNKVDPKATNLDHKKSHIFIW